MVGLKVCVNMIVFGLILIDFLERVMGGDVFGFVVMVLFGCVGLLEEVVVMVVFFGFDELSFVMG